MRQFMLVDVNSSIWVVISEAPYVGRQISKKGRVYMIEGKAKNQQ